MKNKSNYKILAILILFFVVFNLQYNKQETINNNYNTYINQIDSLNIVIDSLDNRYRYLKNTTDSLYRSLIEVDSILSKNKITLDSLNEEKQNNINTVNSFTISELSNFFSERYRYNSSNFE